MLDLSKPVQTRDGQPVKIYATDGRGAYPIHGTIDGHAATWTPGGQILGGRPNERDLVNVPVKHTGWVNAYPDKCWCFYSTREAADEGAGCCRVACIKIEFTEGEGL